MKNFIKTLFAVIFGNVIFYGFFILILLAMIIGASLNSDKSDEISIPKNTILQLNLTGPLTDMSQKSNMNFGSNSEDETGYSIYQVIEAIEKAGQDDDIAALHIPLAMNMEASYAQLDLIRTAISKFKQSKKPVIAYGEMATQKSYYLATLADKIYVNPQGGMDIRGFGAQLTFFKNMIDRLEIQPQIFYAGKFKSATEPFRLEKMSEENKIQTRVLLQDIATDVIENIAKDRKMTPEQVNSAINSMQSNIPEEALSVKMIDGLKYQDEVEAEYRVRLKEDKDEKLTFTNISKYIKSNVTDASEGKIAVYIAEGDIMDGESTESSIGSKTVLTDLRKLAENDHVKAVVLRVNSPGGSALASAVMLREIELLRKIKPVTVSMGNLAASGGYYISTSANKVFAERHTITGSIGVFGIIPNMQKTLENKVGLTFDEVELNEHAALGVTKALDDAEGAKIQQQIEKTYLTFKLEVSRGRKLSMDKVEELAQGRVWSGERAKEMGLVDEIGGLKEAIAYTAKEVKVNKNDYFFSNKRKSDWEKLIEDFGAQSWVDSIKEKLVGSLLGDFSSYFFELKQYTQMKGVQMRMLYQVTI
jgi:protease IV